jgi:hypothetical protein
MQMVKSYFYTNSWAWNQAKSVVKLFEEKGTLENIDSYESLMIYKNII